MLQHQQATVGIHYQGFADLAKLLARVAAAQGLQLHPVKDALAAPVCRKSGFLHSVPIIGLASRSVNCPFGQVCPIAMLFCPATCKPQSAGRRMSLAATASCRAPSIPNRCRAFLHHFLSVISWNRIIIIAPGGMI